jgi:hypothetical protein
VRKHVGRQHRMEYGEVRVAQMEGRALPRPVKARIWRAHSAYARHCNHGTAGKARARAAAPLVAAALPRAFKRPPMHTTEALASPPEMPRVMQRCSPAWASTHCCLLWQM